MAQEIEIEFKTLLEKDDFYKLLRELPFPDEPVTQTNHYFDTKDMTLKQHTSALRIREKDDTYTLTLKQPQPHGVLETHDNLAFSEYQAWIQGNPIAKPHNASLLTDMGIQTADLIHYGSLETRRHAFFQGGMEIVLDESHYLGKHDFELELEAETYESGLAAFENLLEQYNIVKQKPITKIKRFFDALKKAEN